MHRVALAGIGGRGAFTANPRFLPGMNEEIARDPLAEAFQAGFAEGERTAQTAALALRDAEAAERGAIELAFARFDEDSAELLHERLRATVVAICQTMAGDVSIDPAGLAARVEAAASMLRRKHDERVVRLHPADMALVRERIDPALRIEADPSIERGMLRVESEDGGVEDGAEYWRTALAEALGTCAH